MNPRFRLAVAAALFLAWIGWLAYAATGKSRGPVVSRAQAAAATYPLVGEVKAAPDGTPQARVRVVGAFPRPGLPPPTENTEIDVFGLPEAVGFEGDGPYLLLLAKDEASARFYLVGQQRSPGYELGNVGRPFVYRWSPDVQAQAEKLFR